jgi:hypothetical protein
LRVHLPPSLDMRGDGKSFMFLAEIWDQLPQRLPGPLLACVPAHDVCLVTSTGTSGGIASLIAARDRVWSSAPSRPISTTVLAKIADG